MTKLTKTKSVAMTMLLQQGPINTRLIARNLGRPLGTVNYWYYGDYCKSHSPGLIEQGLVENPASNVLRLTHRGLAELIKVGLTPGVAVEYFENGQPRRGEVVRYE